jgi:hypothetical protein
MIRQFFMTAVKLQHLPILFGVAGVLNVKDEPCGVALIAKFQLA